MCLGQFSRFFGLLLAVALANVQAETAKEVLDTEKKDEIAGLVSMGDWEEVLKKTENFNDDSLIKLLRQKARFELKKWEEIEKASANTDPRFSDYDAYVRFLALYESENYEALEQKKIPETIPSEFQEYLSLVRARSFLAQKKLLEAKKAFRSFLDKYPRTRFKSQVMLELANVEWELENKFEALHLYEKIYIYHPISDSDDTASQRLKEMGRFESLDSGVHLKRIHYLQSAALFSKAIRELRHLERKSEGKDKEKIRFSIASLEFARKDYAKAETLARSGLKRSKDDPESQREWKSLLAFSLVRQGQFDKARKIYDEILQDNISAHDKEQILLRLGLMAIDDLEFDQAETYFERLRKEFPQGRYQESSHWFQAWSVIQQHLSANEEDRSSAALKKKLKTAKSLLNEIPKLPQGKPLTGQSLYWRARVESALGESKTAKKTLKSLDDNWSASFYSLLGDTNDFKFLFYQEDYAAPELIVRHEKKFMVADPAFQQMPWKRLEAFVSVHLYRWAQLELENFMKVSGRKNDGLRQAVAHRLEILGDWSDLVRFAQRNFPLELNQINTSEPRASFHYPQAYGEEVLKAANEFQVSPFLLWGVMREESRFQADAISVAGAVGLLQLMPSLANQISTRLREGRVSRAELTDPVLNIRYAAYHLRELIDQVQSWEVQPQFIFPLVVASYNAGAGPVRRWMKEAKDDQLDVFIESIPYSETRNYVKRVIQSANIYWRLYGEKNERIAKGKKGE